MRFRFPSGSLTVRIEHADGSVETIGPAPFVQSRSAGPLDRHGRPPDPGGRSVHDTYQPTTLDPRFEIASLTYNYDARSLAARFPNLDLEDSDGAAGADSITLTFVVSGTDVGGVRRFFARQVVIEGEEVQLTDQSTLIRRRAVR